MEFPKERNNSLLRAAEGIDRHGRNQISRRRFLSLSLGLAAGVLFPSLKRSVAASGSPVPPTFPQFFFTQIKYQGGDWDPNPQFLDSLMEELELRTSIRGMKERRIITLSDPEKFDPSPSGRTYQTQTLWRPWYRQPEGTLRRSKIALRSPSL